MPRPAMVADPFSLVVGWHPPLAWTEANVAAAGNQLARGVAPSVQLLGVGRVWLGVELGHVAAAWQLPAGRPRAG